MVPDRILWPLLLWVLTAANLILAAHNITVDDTSKDIAYTGTWLASHTQPTRYNSTTHYTKVQGSYATFSFTGASQIYYMGYGLIASNVDNTIMQVTFDEQIWNVDQSATTATRAQAILWTSGPIDPSVTHTIVCTKTSADQGGMDMNVDAFILTIPDATTSTQTQTSVSPFSGASTLSSLSDIWSPPPGNPSAASDSSSPSITPITVVSAPSTNKAAIIGGTLGAVALIAIVAAIFFCLGRRKRINEEIKAPTPLFGSDTASPTINVDSRPMGEVGSTMGVSRRTGTTKRREREEDRTRARNAAGGGSSPGASPSAGGFGGGTGARSDPRTSSDVYSIPVHTESGWASGPPAYTPMNSDPLLARSEHPSEPFEEEGSARVSSASPSGKPR